MEYFLDSEPSMSSSMFTTPTGRHEHQFHFDPSDHDSLLMTTDCGAFEDDEIVTWPRLTKEQAEVLENHFNEHPKPDSNAKRQLAISTNMPLPRVSNWFQNRRAKAKQLKKQEEFELHTAREKSEGLGEQAFEPVVLGSCQETSDSSTMSIGTPFLNDATAIQMPPKSTSNFNSPIINSGQEAYASLQRAISAAISARECFNRAASGSLTEAGSGTESYNQWRDHENTNVRSAKPEEIGTSSAFGDWGSSNHAMSIWDPARNPSPVPSSPLFTEPCQHVFEQDTSTSPTSIDSNPDFGLVRSRDTFPRSSLRAYSEPLEEDEELASLFRKHYTLTRLMREVYSMLSTDLKDVSDRNFRSAAAHSSGTTGSASINQSKTQSSRGSKKRWIHDRGSPSRDRTNGDDQKRNRQKPGQREGSDHLLYACPFFKFDSRKYTCTSSTRTKYRTCAGPGFDSIARLKQHLKRTHGTTVQCLRCWQGFPDQRALASHSRDENQCQVLPEQVVEGIPQHKWEMIKSRWGATWSDVYEIIFPGAPIPASYHDSDKIAETLSPASPSSREIAEYEAYSRSELPRLVESILEGMIQAETEPIEERYKPLLVDIVRNCQSTVSQRWDMIRGACSSPRTEKKPASTGIGGQRVPSAMSACRLAERDTATESTTIPSIYQMPPPLGAEVAMSTLEAFEGSQSVQEGTASLPSSDSGYNSHEDPGCNEFCSCDFLKEYFLDGSQNYASSSKLADGLDFSWEEPSLQENPQQVENLDVSADGCLIERKLISCFVCGGWRFD